MRYRMNSTHRTRSGRALVAFDAVGGGLDLVSAWQIDDGIVTISTDGTLADPLVGGPCTGWYAVRVEGFGRGLVMARPGWMDDDLPIGELATPRPEVGR